MSGDSTARKRGNKRRKKDVGNVQAEQASAKMKASFDEDDGSPPLAPGDERMHIQKESKTGGGVVSKVIFFILFLGLLGTAAVVILEYRGTSDVDIPTEESRFGSLFAGWVDETPEKHDVSGEEDHEGEEEDHDEEGHDEHSEEEEEGGSEEEDPEDDELEEILSRGIPGVTESGEDGGASEEDEKEGGEDEGIGDEVDVSGEEEEEEDDADDDDNAVEGDEDEGSQELHPDQISSTLPTPTIDEIKLNKHSEGGKEESVSSRMKTIEKVEQLEKFMPVDLNAPVEESPKIVREIIPDKVDVPSGGSSIMAEGFKKADMGRGDLESKKESSADDRGVSGGSRLQPRGGVEETESVQESIQGGESLPGSGAAKVDRLAAMQVPREVDVGVVPGDKPAGEHVQQENRHQESDVKAPPEESLKKLKVDSVVSRVPTVEVPGRKLENIGEEGKTPDVESVVEPVMQSSQDKLPEASLGDPPTKVPNQKPPVSIASTGQTMKSGDVVSGGVIKSTSVKVETPSISSVKLEQSTVPISTVEGSSVSIDNMGQSGSLKGTVKQDETSQDSKMQNSADEATVMDSEFNKATLKRRSHTENQVHSTERKAAEGDKEEKVAHSEQLLPVKGGDSSKPVSAVASDTVEKPIKVVLETAYAFEGGRKEDSKGGVGEVEPKGAGGQSRNPLEGEALKPSSRDGKVFLSENQKSVLSKGGDEGGVHLPSEAKNANVDKASLITSHSATGGNEPTRKDGKHSPTNDPVKSTLAKKPADGPGISVTMKSSTSDEPALPQTKEELDDEEEDDGVESGEEGEEGEEEGEVEGEEGEEEEEEEGKEGEEEGEEEEEEGEGSETEEESSGGVKKAEPPRAQAESEEEETEEEESEEEEEVPPPPLRRGRTTGAQMEGSMESIEQPHTYEKADITNEEDFVIREELDEADAEIEKAFGV